MRNLRPEAVYRDSVAAADVEHLTAGFRRCGARQHVCADHVGYEGEIARLFPVTVDSGRLVCHRRDDELRDNRGVLRCGILARPEDIEVPKGYRFQAEGSVYRPAV